MTTMTYDEAINALVEQDVQRWGEDEREASRRVHLRDRPSLGLALNGLAARAELADSPDAPDLRRAADAALTPEDRRALRMGG